MLKVYISLTRRLLDIAKCVFHCISSTFNMYLLRLSIHKKGSKEKKTILGQGVMENRFSKVNNSLPNEESCSVTTTVVLTKQGQEARLLASIPVLDFPDA